MPPLPDNLIGAGEISGSIKKKQGPLTTESVQDDDLKRLLMSWYYSGYYTGFYEGKQAARQTHPTG